MVSRSISHAQKQATKTTKIGSIPARRITPQHGVLSFFCWSRLSLHRTFGGGLFVLSPTTVSSLSPPMGSDSIVSATKESGTSSDCQGSSVSHPRSPSDLPERPSQPSSPFSAYEPSVSNGSLGITLDLSAKYSERSHADSLEPVDASKRPSLTPAPTPQAPPSSRSTSALVLVGPQRPDGRSSPLGERADTATSSSASASEAKEASEPFPWLTPSEIDHELQLSVQPWERVYQ
jgi:hypothetical protein